MSDANTTAGGRRNTAQPAARTPDLDDTVLGDIDTARMRNAVQQRLFGGTVDPVRIGRFPILRRLGQGGMGVVYAAYDNELDRRIAIKLLRADSRRGDAGELRGRLLREAKALARLSHPSVVQVYEAGEHDGQVYLAMEFVEGVTLRRWVEDDRRSQHDIVAMYLDAARGLAAAHAVGLVHRDFKPDNAIVGIDGRVRVLDFGLALAAADANEAKPADGLDRISAPLERLTHSGALLGTPAYMAPEQFAGARADARTDQFSFAVALFEALYQRRPFPGESLPDLMSSVARGRVMWPSTPRVRSKLQRILRRALAPDASDRFPAIDQLVAALERALSHTGRNIGLAMAAASVLVGGTWSMFGWMLGAAEERASALSEEVDSERTRADVAEDDLRARADNLTVAQARFMLSRDPTLAVALLAQLSPDSELWASDAWAIATQASIRGVAVEEVPVPTGYAGRELLGDGSRALVATADAEQTLSIWTIATGEVRELGFGDATSTRSSALDGRTLVLVDEQGMELFDLETQSSKILWSGAIPRSPRVHNDVFLLVPVAQPRDAELEYRIWTMPEGTPAGGGRVPAHAIVAMSRDGRKLLHIRRDELALLHRESDVRDPLGPLNTFLYGETTDLSMVVVGTASGIAAVNTADGSRRTLELPWLPSAAAFAPDDRRLAITSETGRVGWIDLHDPALRYDEARGPGRSSAIEMVHWSPEGNRVAATHSDGSISLWDPALRRRVALFEGLRSGVHLVARDDGSVLALDDRTLRRWNHPRSPWDAVRGGVKALRGSAGTIVTQRLDDEIEVWAPDPIQLGKFGASASIATSADGRVVAIGDDQRVALWHRDDGWLPEIDLPTASDTFGLRLASDGAWIVVVDTPDISVRDTRSGRERSRTTSDLQSIVLIEPGELCGFPDSGPQIECIDLGSGARTRTFAVPGDPWEVAASPTGTMLAVVLDRHGVFVIDVESGSTRAMQGLPPPKETELSFSPDGALLVATMPAGEAYAWQVASGVAIGELVAPPPRSIGRADLLTRDIVWDRVAFVDDTTLLVLDGWDDVRRVELAVPAGRAQLQEWVAAATTARVDPDTVDWSVRESASIK